MHFKSLGHTPTSNMIQKHRISKEMYQLIINEQGSWYLSLLRVDKNKGLEFFGGPLADLIVATPAGA
jgi:hypothetical protein